jgi:hypothetical protein
MENFLDEPRRQEPSDLFPNGLPPFIVEAAEALFDRFGTGQDIKVVLGDLPWDSWHIGQFSCKDVLILEHEVGELTLLPVEKAATDSNGLAGIFEVYLYHLGVFSELEGPCRLLPCAGFRRDFSHGGLNSL